MNLETLVKFHNDLVSFDLTKPIVVTYLNDRLLFRQFNKLVACPYLDNYYFPKKLKLGVLLPMDASTLAETLVNLMQDKDLVIGNLNTGIHKLGFDVYKTFNGLVGPQVAYKVDFCSITNTLLAKIILRHSGSESKLLLKAIKNESRKSRKSIKVTTTPEV